MKKKIHRQKVNGVQQQCSEHSTATSAKSGCMRTARLHPKPAFDADVRDVRKIRKNSGKLQESKEECHSDTEH